MRVQSILNNNAVVTQMEDGATAIVLGSGLGYSLKRGDLIPQERIREIYRAQSSKNNALIGMLDSISPLCLEISTRILEAARQQSRQEYSPFLLIELADHLSLALERQQAGICPANLLVDEMKALYPAEFEVARQALDWVRQSTGIRLCEEEAGFIAMHLISSRAKQTDRYSEERAVNLTNEMLSVVHKYFGPRLKTDQILYARFLTHLKFLAARILQAKPMDSEKLADLYDTLGTVEHGREFAQELKAHILRKYDYQLCSDEIFYITIHLRVLLK